MKSNAKQIITSLVAMVLSLSAASAQAGIETREEAEAALRLLDSAIASEPRQAINYVLRGDMHYNLNDMQQAATDYSTAILLDDKQDKAYFGRGMAYGRMGRIDEGIADLSVFIKRNPNDSVAYTKRGVRNIWRGNLEEAERDLTRAVELDPNNAEAHDDLGVVHAQHKRLTRAAQHFSAAIKLDPGYQKAYHNLAIVWFMAGKPQTALAAVDAGLNLNGEHRNSLVLKAAILKALGREAEAKDIEARAEFLPEGNWTERSAIGATANSGGKP